MIESMGFKGLINCIIAGVAILVEVERFLAIAVEVLKEVHVAVELRGHRRQLG
jgi:hypothetical protein